MHHCVEDYAAGPNIDLARVVFLLVQHLWWGIAWGSAGRSQFLLLLEEISQPKVSNLDLPFFPNQYILRLHVSMRDP